MHPIHASPGNELRVKSCKEIINRLKLPIVEGLREDRAPVDKIVSSMHVLCNISMFINRNMIQMRRHF